MDSIGDTNGNINYQSKIYQQGLDNLSYTKMKELFMPEKNYFDNIYKYVNTAAYNTVTESSDQIISNWIFNHANEIEDIIADKKAKDEYAALTAKQNLNKYFRSLVKHVKFSGDTCIIYGNDNTITKSRWDHDEEYDPEKAILAAIARKHFGNTNLYCEVLKEYAEAGWEHYHDYIVPEIIEKEEKEWSWL